MARIQTRQLRGDVQPQSYVWGRSNHGCRGKMDKDVSQDCKDLLNV